MSYEKAMKHSIKKSRKQANNHFGFHTGTGSFKETPKIRAFNVQCMEVNRWFADRNSNGDSQYMRECIREAVARLREMKITNLTTSKVA